MSILQGILDTYAQFFDLDMWIKVLQDPVSWGLIGTLVVLEGLLSADNALVLAVMVKHLPEEKRKKSIILWTYWSLCVPLYCDWNRNVLN